MRIDGAIRATRNEALEPLRSGFLRHFSTIAESDGRGIALRHSHGSQYVSNSFQQGPLSLGIKPSYSLVRGPKANSCADCVIRTLKERLLPSPRLRSHVCLSSTRPRLITSSGPLVIINTELQHRLDGTPTGRYRIGRVMHPSNGDALPEKSLSGTRLSWLVSRQVI